MTERELIIHCDDQAQLDLIHLIRCFYKVTGYSRVDGVLRFTHVSKEPYWDDLKDSKFYDGMTMAEKREDGNERK